MAEILLQILVAGLILVLLYRTADILLTTIRGLRKPPAQTKGRISWAFYARGMIAAGIVTAAGLIGFATTDELWFLVHASIGAVILALLTLMRFTGA